MSDRLKARDGSLHSQHCDLFSPDSFDTSRGCSCTPLQEPRVIPEAPLECSLSIDGQHERDWICKHCGHRMSAIEPSSQARLVEIATRWLTSRVYAPPSIARNDVEYLLNEIRRLESALPGLLEAQKERDALLAASELLVQQRDAAEDRIRERELEIADMKQVEIGLRGYIRSLEAENASLFDDFWRQASRTEKAERRLASYEEAQRRIEALPRFRSGHRAVQASDGYYLERQAVLSILNESASPKP